MVEENSRQGLDPEAILKFQPKNFFFYQDTTPGKKLHTATPKPRYMPPDDVGPQATYQR